MPAVAWELPKATSLLEKDFGKRWCRRRFSAGERGGHTLVSAHADLAVAPVARVETPIPSVCDFVEEIFIYLFRLHLLEGLLFEFEVFWFWNLVALNGCTSA